MSTATRPVTPVRFAAPDFDEFAETAANPAHDETGPEDWVCGFCDRGQCARCSDQDCTCCNGNPEEQPWR